MAELRAGLAFGGFDDHRSGNSIDVPNGGVMIILGAILLVIGLLAGISILTTIGGILLVVGLILTVLGAVGRPIGRKTYF
nr:hypothetical protein [Kibdelosporangium sp. MJ126-NF4]